MASLVKDPAELEAGEIYRFEYRLKGTRSNKFAQLQLLDKPKGGKYELSGRPGIGSLVFNADEVVRMWRLEPYDVKCTYFNKKSPV